MWHRGEIIHRHILGACSGPFCRKIFYTNDAEHQRLLHQENKLVEQLQEITD